MRLINQCRVQRRGIITFEVILCQLTSTHCSYISINHSQICILFTCAKELTQSDVLKFLKSCAALIGHTIPPLLMVVDSMGPHHHFHICSQQASTWTLGSNYYRVHIPNIWIKIRPFKEFTIPYGCIFMHTSKTNKLEKTLIHCRIVQSIIVFTLD